MSTSEVVLHQPQRGEVVRAEDFLPLMTVDQAIERKEQINKFITGVMRDGEDYGYMPGDNKKEKKKVLLKPGAEKLTSIFGLSPRYEAEQIIEDWTGKEHGGEPLFYYRYKCQLYRGDRFMGEAVGSSNSWEAKHRYRWLGADQLPAGSDPSRYQSRGSRRTLFEPHFAYEKRDTEGQYGKPETHWALFDKAIKEGTTQNVTRTSKAGKPLVGYEIEVDQTVYRVPNADYADVINTCQKIAQKRALVAAVLIVTNCSDAFTQDLEDSEPGSDTGGHPHGTQAAADHVAQTKINGGPLPKELAALLAAIDKNISAFRTGCETLSKMMSDKAGANGIKAYDDIVMKFSEKWPTGCTDKKELKAFIQEVWAAFEKVEPAKTADMFEGTAAK